MIPTDLRCHRRVDPQGIDATTPRLSWAFANDDKRRGQCQQAFRILVADRMARLDTDEGNLWDSGRIVSSAQAAVYAGQPLASRQSCFWKVHVWDPAGNASPWSHAARWSMGLLHASDWQAEWIEVPFDLTQEMIPGLIPASAFRRTFEIAVPPERASLFVSALGIYEVRLNGNRVGANELAPEWTDYDRRVHYQTFDVTGLLRCGANTLSADVAEGWYAGRIGFWKEHGHYGSFRPRFLAQLDMEEPDGRTACIATDARWKGSIDGPIRFAGLLDGQIVDARIAGGDGAKSGWQPVRIATGLDHVQRTAQMNEPVRIIEELTPLSVNRMAPQTAIVDMGQNMVGWCRLRLREDTGRIVNLRHTEVLDEAGALYTAPLRYGIYNKAPLLHHGIYGMMGGARQMDTYICAGTGEEEFEPRFTQHGFRYVEITGIEPPQPENITGCVVSSSVERAGWFECSDSTVTRLVEAIRWTQLGNLQGIPLDCPQRDERLGWLGDAQVFCQASCFNGGMAAFYAKFLRDVRDAQWPNGRFADFAPNPLGDKRAMGAPAWSDAGLIIPWTHYVNYGDPHILAEHYPAARRHVESIAAGNPDHLWLKDTGNNYGDHLNGQFIQQDHWSRGGATPKDVFATAFYANSVALLARMAAALGHEADAAHYQNLHRSIVEAFRTAFVAEDGCIKGDTQGAYVLALHFDLLTQPQRERAVQHLLRLLDVRGGYPDTGIQTTNRMLLELSRAGQTDVAYQILNNDRIPSWRHMLEHGATTIWERWDSLSDTNGFQDPAMNSFNHYAMGAVAEWIYRTIGGINPDPEAPGFRNVVIHPQPGGGITWARTAHRCVRGMVRTEWQMGDGTLDLDVDVPPNTTATIYIPCDHSKSVTEGDACLDTAEGILHWRQTGTDVVVRVASGQYAFRVKDGRGMSNNQKQGDAPAPS